MIDKQPRTTDRASARPMTLIDYYEDRNWSQRYRVEQGAAKPLARQEAPAGKSQERLQK